MDNQMDNLVRKAGLSEAIFSKTKTLQKSDKICHTYHSSHSNVIGETSMISYVQLQQVTGKVRSQYKSWKSANSGQIATHPAAQHWAGSVAKMEEAKKSVCDEKVNFLFSGQCVTRPVGQQAKREGRQKNVTYF